MKKQYLLLLSSFLLMPITFNNNNYLAKADLIINEDDNDALATISHIRNNLDQLNQERAAAGYLTSVTSFTTMDITINSYTEENIAGFLLDFDGDKGYIVIGPNMRYYDLSFVGNSPVPSGHNNRRYYSDYKGYYYINNENEQIDIGFPNQPDSGTTAVEIMDGQLAAGESLITDVQAYNDDKYGTSFIYTREHTVYNRVNVAGYMDMHLSFYYIWDGIKMTYPDLGGYTAGYSAGKFLAFATNNTTYNNENKIISYTPGVNENANYNAMLEKGYSSSSSREISQFTYDYRSNIISVAGSDEGVRASEVVQALSNMYGSSITYQSYTEYSFARTDMNMLDNNQPVIFEFNDSDYYGERTVIVCGYKLYTRTKSFLGVTKTDIRFYLEYKDGITREQSMWFDFNFCLNKIGQMYSIGVA